MKRNHAFLLWLMLMVSALSRAQDADLPRAANPSSVGEDLNRGAQIAFEDQLSLTRAALKITSPQAPYWQAFEDKVRALMADMTRALPAPDNQTAPQKIGRNVDTVRDRLTAMEEIAAAAKALYDQLDTKQKTIADLRLPAAVPPLYSGLGPPVRPPMMEGQRGRRFGASQP